MPKKSTTKKKTDTPISPDVGKVPYRGGPQQLSLEQKLFKIQEELPDIEPDAYNDFHKYAYRSGSIVMGTIKQFMVKYKLILVPSIHHWQMTPHEIFYQKANSVLRTGYITEAVFFFKWVDTETGESMECPWYGQGVDSQEKGIGKAQTYAIKNFLSAFFLISDYKLDPDDNRNQKFDTKTPQYDKHDRNFDFLQDAGKIKKEIDDAEYYQILSIFNGAKHSTEVGQGHREICLQSLKDVQARNERFKVSVFPDLKIKLEQASFDGLMGIYEIDEDNLPLNKETQVNFYNDCQKELEKQGKSNNAPSGNGKPDK